MSIRRSQYLNSIFTFMHLLSAYGSAFIFHIFLILTILWLLALKSLYHLLHFCFCNFFSLHFFWIFWLFCVAFFAQTSNPSSFVLFNFFHIFKETVPVWNMIFWYRFKKKEKSYLALRRVNYGSIVQNENNGLLSFQIGNRQGYHMIL